MNKPYIGLNTRKPRGVEITCLTCPTLALSEYTGYSPLSLQRFGGILLIKKVFIK